MLFVFLFPRSIKNFLKADFSILLLKLSLPVFLNYFLILPDLSLVFLVKKRVFK